MAMCFRHLDCGRTIPVGIDGVLRLGKVLHAKQRQGQQMGFLFLEHGLNLTALAAVNALSGPLGFPVFEVQVLFLNRFK